MNDRLGEAKSSGNLGNTLKVVGRFEEAALCCERHLEIVSFIFFETHPIFFMNELFILKLLLITVY